ncbi:1725_t:CDS:2, partial [Racocetra persica]
ENKNNEESDLFNNQEGGVEYDTEVRNLLNESETCSQELSTILAAFRTYQHEAKNILSENEIMDLRPSSEFVLLCLKEVEYDLLIEKVFEPIDKIFPKEADDFLIDFFSEKLSEQQWEDKIESLMEDNAGQNKFIIKLKRLIIETLPIFFDSYKLMSDNPLKNKEMTEEEYMNTYINPILKNALTRFSDIRYVPGGKAIKASTYRKTMMEGNPAIFLFLSRNCNLGREADKKFQESRNKRSSRLSNSHNIRKLLRLSHNDDRG